MKTIYKIVLSLLLLSCVSKNIGTHDTNNNPLPPPYKPDVVIPSVTANFLTVTKEDIGDLALNCISRGGKVGKATFSINNSGSVGGIIGVLGLDSNANKCTMITYIWKGGAEITRIWGYDIPEEQSLNIVKFREDNSFIGTINSPSEITFLYYIQENNNKYILYRGGDISYIANNNIYFSSDASYAAVNIGWQFTLYDLHGIKQDQVLSYKLDETFVNIYGISEDGIYATDEKSPSMQFYTPKICHTDFHENRSTCKAIDAFNSYDQTTIWRTMGVSPNNDYIFIMSKKRDEVTSFISVNKSGATTRKITLPEVIADGNFTIFSVTDKGDFLVKNSSKEILYFYSYNNNRFYEFPTLMSMIFGNNRVVYADHKEVKLSANAEYMLLDFTNSTPGGSINNVDDIIAVRVVFPEYKGISDYLNLYWDAYQNSDKIWD